MLQIIERVGINERVDGNLEVIGDPSAQAALRVLRKPTTTDGGEVERRAKGGSERQTEGGASDVAS